MGKSRRKSWKKIKPTNNFKTNLEINVNNKHKYRLCLTQFRGKKKQQKKFKIIRVYAFCDKNLFQ